MEERKIGLAPRVMAQGAMGPKEYAVLVTDRRSIFVLEFKSKAGIGGALGGMIGAAIASAADSRMSFDYENENPEMLASEKGSIAIPHDSLEHVRFKSGMLGNWMQIEYRSEEGKTKKLGVSLVPPNDYMKEKKDNGVKGKAAMHEYVNEVQSLFRRALPLTAASKVEWIE